jgi:hypothetical protein
MISLFSNTLTTCRIASASLIFARNLLPNHSPFDAHATIHAISINSQLAGIIFLPSTAILIFSNLSSLTFTIHTFGSIVQKGKFWASAE